MYKLLKLVLLALFVCTGKFLLSQHPLAGTWQGIIVQGSQGWSESNILWLELEIDGENKIQGWCRDELPYTGYYAFKRITGKVLSDTSLEYSQRSISKQENKMGKFWCLSDAELTYNSRTGYLEGNWSATDCRGAKGRVIFYRSEYQMSKTDTATLHHKWRDQLVEDLSKGRKSPQVRKREMENFKFRSVHFDYDEFFIREEYIEYLTKMAEILDGHTDLRLKIIGHTDSDGSENYNEGLSENRAETVRKFFLDRGIPPHKVVIEYRGESDPISENATPEGKQRNRRVDFEFI